MPAERSRPPDPPERRPSPRSGVLGGPIDLEGRRRPPPRVAATPGLAVKHRASDLEGVVVSMVGEWVTVRDRRGKDRRERVLPGNFLVEGRPVTLTPPPRGAAPVSFTASGSIAVNGLPARTARASRILVEGVHDAELVEKVWGDDLRVEGVVVERLDGVDGLAAVVRGFGPRPGRRLGVLVDHLVTGSKEQRLAAEVDHPDVLVRGHPYVDIWAAVRPRLLGIPAWPAPPKGTPWKEGVCAALGVADPGRFWRELLGRVRTYADLEAPLVGAVEELIDFVTAE